MGKWFLGMRIAVVLALGVLFGSYLQTLAYPCIPDNACALRANCSGLVGSCYLTSNTTMKCVPYDGVSCCTDYMVQYKCDGQDIDNDYCFVNYWDCFTK
jgi:hypothetical protein